MTTSEKVRRAIESESGRSVDEATALDDLEMDSLEFMSMIVAVEAVTGKQIPAERLGALRSVADIVRESE